MKKKILGFFITFVMIVCCMTQKSFAKSKGKVKSISVKNLPSSALTLKKGMTKKLKVEVKVKGKISTKYTMQSSNKRIVKISKGKLYALKNGKANITITSKGNKRIKKVIKVIVGQPVSSISIKSYKAVLKVGAQVKLKASVGLKNASNKRIIWSTSNKKVMKIKNNKVYMLKKGKATVKGTAADGSSKSASIRMTVKDVSSSKTSKKKTNSKTKPKTKTTKSKTKTKKTSTKSKTKTTNRKGAKTRKKTSKKKVKKKTKTVKKYLVIGTPIVVKKTYTVTFDSMGGTAVAKQKVTENKYAKIPANPTKAGNSFLWWYKDEESKPFAFNDDKIKSNITLHAKWYDTTGNNFVDSDNDGIEDDLEKMMGLNPNKSDSDDDGVSDENEIMYGFDPTKSDTDNNGVKDGDEDADQDGLSTIREIANKTHPFNKDTDSDGLTDGSEIDQYKTDPLKKDTDGDGANDSYEVKAGTDPNKYDDSFNIKVSADGSANVTGVSVNLSGDGEQAQSVAINKNETGLINDKIPGYIGDAYDFNAKDTKNLDAKITFSFNKSILDNGEEPTIYYLNPETYQLEEMDTDVDEEKGTAEADTTHFSTYVLLNKKSIDNVWNNDIDAPEITNPDDVVGLSTALVVDRSESMNDNDPEDLRLDLTKDMIRKLTNKDLGSLVSFIRNAEVITPLTSDKEKLLKDVDTIENDDGHNNNSGTDCSEGLMVGMKQLSGDTSGNRRCVIMMTDGNDTESTYSYDDEVIPYAKKNNIHIYTIGLGSVDETLLKKISASTGGRYYHAEDSSSLNDIYKQAETDTVSNIFVDQNKDGISDQYVKWLTKQPQIINDGFNPFSGLSYNDIQANADYDQDGLNNGDEIKIEPDNDGYMTVKMSSNPASADSDNDGLLDFYPVKKGDEEIAPPDAERMIPVTPRGLWKYHIKSVNNSSENDSENMPYAQKYKDLLSITKNKRVKKVLNSHIFQEMVPNFASAVYDVIKDTPLTDENSFAFKSTKSIILTVKELTTTMPSMIEKPMKLNNDDVAMVQAYGGAIFLNFKPDEYKSALHAYPNTWQKGYGYTEAYDYVFTIGSNMSRRIIEFEGDDGHIYRLWQWKGDYWNLHTGAETGIYYQDENNDAVYRAISKGVPMSLSLYHFISSNKSCTLHWSPLDNANKESEQWWITGFNWRIMDPDPSEYASVTSIDFSTRTSLYDSLKSAVSNNSLKINEGKDEINSDTILFDDATHKIWLAWKS